MSTAKVKSQRGIHRGWKKWYVWNHGNWTKIDRLMRRRERHAARQELRRNL